MRDISRMEEWLKNLNDEAILIYHHLDLYKELNEIVSKNQQLHKMDNTVIDYMKRAFTLDLAIGICRICDTSQKSASLVQFLQELKKRSEYLTRAHFISLYPKSDSVWANKDFDNLAGKNEKLFSLDKIESDIRMVTKEEPFNKIKTYRDKYLAHSDRVKRKISFTYNELFKAFGILEKIIKKYNLLIRATNFLKLTPTMQGKWQEVFTVPWI